MSRIPYLSSNEKHSLVLALSSLQFLQRSGEMFGAKFPKEARTWLKTGTTFVNKATDRILESIDAKTSKSLVNIVHDTQIGIIARGTVGKKVDDVNEEFIRAKEFGHRLAEGTLYGVCRVCDGSPAPECPIREALAHFGVPAWDENAVDCEYRGSGGVDG